MPNFLGIDTSNYTTSVSLYDNECKTIVQEKLLLPVKAGELGLRQSDAVFHHTKQLPILINNLFSTHKKIDAIGVSTKPRNSDGSYMPCFLAGEGLAESISSLMNIPLVKTSHQAGHIISALFSCEQLNLINQRFIAFHVSGGTTDCLFVEPDKTDIIKITQISSSMDLKAGQAIDRIGVMLGLNFPCGKELEKLAFTSNREFKITASMKELDCSLSGVENKCKKMLADGEKPNDIAKFCIDYILKAIDEMTYRALKKLGNFPLIFAGGVMSNSIIREKITNKYGASFAAPEFSCDNAAGVAILTALALDY